MRGVSVSMRDKKHEVGQFGEVVRRGDEDRGREMRLVGGGREGSGFRGRGSALPY